MNVERKPLFSGGQNIALKVPSHHWTETISFYRDVLGLEVIEPISDGTLSVCFEFGVNRLWVDRMDDLQQAEIWLELNTADIPKAAAHLKSAGIQRCDEVETLPDGFEGFWIRNPASLIHLIAKHG